MFLETLKNTINKQHKKNNNKEALLEDLKFCGFVNMSSTETFTNHEEIFNYLKDVCANVENVVVIDISMLVRIGR